MRHCGRLFPEPFYAKVRRRPGTRSAPELTSKRSAFEIPHDSLRKQTVNDLLIIRWFCGMFLNWDGWMPCADGTDISVPTN